MSKKTIIGVVIAIILIIVAVIGYVLLGNASENDTTKTNRENNNSQLAQTNNNIATNNVAEQPVNSDSKVLIVYFSETGNTEKFANIIHEQIGGDLFKIEPVTPYPTGEELFDYTKQEQDEDRRPEIQGTVDISQYDTIFIGYPIWWYEVPQIIKTFLDTYDLSGKTIIPFNTHEGSGDGGTYDYIAEQEPNATMLEGLPIRGGNMEQDQTSRISNWLKDLGFEV
jgi:flavodoxin